MNDQKQEYPKCIKNFVAALQAENLAASTVRTYSSLMLKFMQQHKTTDPERISRQQIITYLAQIPAPKTKKQVFWTLHKFYKTAGQPRKLAKLPAPKQGKHLPEYLNETQLAKLLDAVTNLKHRALLTTIYAGGLRISELLNLKVQDVDGQNGYLKIKNSKGAKDRPVPVPPATINLLRQYYRVYQPNRYLFEGQKTGQPYTATSASKVLKAALRKSGIKQKLTLHGLRHSRATHLARAGMATHLLKDFLGHYKTETTEVYRHLSINDLAAWVQNCDTQIAFRLNESINLNTLPA